MREMSAYNPFQRVEHSTDNGRGLVVREGSVGRTINFYVMTVSHLFSEATA